MSANVPTIEMGTAMLGMAVARSERRKTKTTIVTRMTLRTSVFSTSSTEARMVFARSMATWTVMAGEMEVASVEEVRLLSCDRRRHPAAL